MKVEDLKKLEILLTWSLRWYPEREVAYYLREEVRREIKIKTLNPVTGEYNE